jgi:hypothetical protein
MKMGYMLAAAVVAGGLFALVEGAGVFDRSAPAPTAPQAARHAPAAPGPAAREGDPSSEAIDGTVAEAIDVPSYTYLRISLSGKGGDAWAAVTTARLSVGAPVRVRVSTKMVDFASPTLGRTFPVIYFGVIDTDGEKAAPAPPHAAPASSREAPAKPVARAPGPNGRTVAEAIAKRSALSGKTVQVRGVVVKVTAGVLGATFIHLRDGSGDPDAGTDDLAVSMKETPQVGDVILVEGTLASDRDLGAGYRYDAILEHAQIVSK